MAANPRFADPNHPTRDEIAVVVAELLDELGVDWHVGDDEGAHLFDELGFDSFDAYEMIVMIEEAFVLAVDDSDFASVFTVGAIIEAIATHYAQSPTG